MSLYGRPSNIFGSLAGPPLQKREGEGRTSQTTLEVLTSQLHPSFGILWKLDSTLLWRLMPCLILDKPDGSCTHEAFYGKQPYWVLTTMLLVTICLGEFNTKNQNTQFMNSCYTDQPHPRLPASRFLTRIVSQWGVGVTSGKLHAKPTLHSMVIFSLLLMNLRLWLYRFNSSCPAVSSWSTM